MIKYKKLKELCEATQRGSVYHYTTADNAHEILKGDTLYGSEMNDPPSVSTTRNKDFHKTSYKWKGRKMKGGVATDVSLELDGDKISQTKKIKPFSYLGNKKGKTSQYPSDESEEQIKGDIPNVKKYVKKIRIHGDVSQDDLNNLKSHNIPIEHDKKD